jgi:hypothetical protein
MGSQNGKPIHNHWEMQETHHESLKKDLGPFQKEPRNGSYIDYRFPRKRLRGVQQAHNGGLGHVMGESRPIPRLPGLYRPNSPQRTRANLGINEATVHTFGDVPPEAGIQGGPASHRSCSVFYNKDGMGMSNETHFGKVGSKHMVNTRCVPELDPEKRRNIYRDPGANLRAEPFSTTSHQVGLFNHFHKIRAMGDKPAWNKRLDFLTYDWDHTYDGLPDDGASARSSRSRAPSGRSQSMTSLRGSGRK